MSLSILTANCSGFRSRQSRKTCKKRKYIFKAKKLLIGACKKENQSYNLESERAQEETDKSKKDSKGEV